MNHDWDELASAYLDGEATEEEIALVESTPAAMAIVAEFQTIASTSAVPPPGSALQSQQIAKALDLFDELAGVSVDPGNESSPTTVRPAPVETSSASTNVTDLATHRRRNGWLASAAAGVVLIAGFGIAGSQLGGGQDESSTDSAEVAVQETSDGGDGGRASALIGPASSAEAEGAAADDNGADQANVTDDGQAEVSPAEDSPAGDSAETDEALSEEDAISEEADASATTTGQSPNPSVELELGQDLFVAIDELEAVGVLDDPSLRSDDRFPLMSERCPTELAELTEPLVISVLFDGAPAELFYDRSTTDGPERLIVITSTCSILAADQRS